MLFKRSFVCAGCRRRFTEENVRGYAKNTCICTECYNDISKTSPMSTFEGLKEISFVTAPFLYRGKFREIYSKYKFRGNVNLGKVLSEFFREYFRDFEDLREYDYIVPVPLSKKRMVERGFNQVDIFAEVLSECTDVPVFKCVNRIKNTVKQSDSRAIERFNNMRSAFQCEMKFNGERFIVVDDIYTTGNTTYSMARELLRAGAGEVCVAVLAYNYTKRREFII